MPTEYDEVSPAFGRPPNDDDEVLTASKMLPAAIFTAENELTNQNLLDEIEKLQNEKNLEKKFYKGIIEDMKLAMEKVPNSKNFLE